MLTWEQLPVVPRRRKLPLLPSLFPGFNPKTECQLAAPRQGAVPQTGSQNPSSIASGGYSAFDPLCWAAGKNGPDRLVAAKNNGAESMEP